MKQIPLTHGKFALVDDEDFDRISCNKWRALARRGSWYAVRNTSRSLGPRRFIQMHTEIMGRSGVDHRNRDGLDNRRRNLRFATIGQNNANRGLPRHNTSGVLGVYWSEHRRRWAVQIKVNSRVINLGRFSDKITAAHARRQAELAYFGEFAPSAT